MRGGGGGVGTTTAEGDGDGLGLVEGGSSDASPWTTTKRLKFKQMNIPAQIPAILSKKFHKAATKAGGMKLRSEKVTRKEKQPEEEQEGDADSIGSASDLRADEEGEQSKSSVGGGGGEGGKDRREDGISESIRTCGSSSYHAECESLTTNEDSVSRLRVSSRKLRLKRRNELNALAEANRHPEQHDEEDDDDNDEDVDEMGVHHVDKPLLLDDELDYGLDSEDQRNVQTTSDDTQQEEEEDDQDTTVAEGVATGVGVNDDDDDEFDVFGRAPFKMPEIPKRVQMRARDLPSRDSLETPRAELDFVFPEPSAAVATSTPMKTTTTTTILGIPEQTSASLNPFLPPPPPQIHSSSTFGTVTVNSSSTSTSTCSGCVDHKARSSASDLFGSEPFPSVVPWPTVVMTLPQPPPPPLKSVVSSSSLPPAPKPRIDRPPVAVPGHFNTSACSSSSILPIADNEFVNFAADDPILGDCVNELEEADHQDLMDQDGEEREVEMRGCGEILGDGGGKKKGKSKKFKLNGGSLVVTKLKIPNYKKQVSGGGGGGGGSSAGVLSGGPGVEAQSQEKETFSYHSLKRDVRSGFNNMSFEDFPSDEQEQFEQQTVGKKFSKAGTTKLNKIVPFEVVRGGDSSRGEGSKLMLGEKKFGSLKRRSNPFS